MRVAQPSCPLARKQVIDRYFLEHRAKLLDLAAFLDRLDRAEDSHSKPAPGVTGGPNDEDHRITALRAALSLLTDGRPHRARRILEHFSDPTTDPIPTAPTKAATGAPLAPLAPTP